jgi:starvation-inducible DNA-binding protein
MDRGAVAPKLQGMLIELTDLALNAKQAHWNVTGPMFRPLHEQLDELADDARGWSDEVAERLVAIGLPAHGRVDAVATLTPLPAFPAGFVEDAKAVTAIVELLDEIIGRTRPKVEQLDHADPVSQDLLLRVTAGLEKHRWTFSAQQR